MAPSSSMRSLYFLRERSPLADGETPLKSHQYATVTQKKIAKSTGISLL
jgi:hypothetical protein